MCVKKYGNNRVRRGIFNLSIITNLVVFIVLNVGILRRCFVCRSRGELGSCKDGFNFNATLLGNEKGVTADPCASGWCAKIIQGRSINNGK